MKSKNNKVRSAIGKLLIIIVLLTSKAMAQNCTVNAGVGYSVCPGNPFVLDGNASGVFQGSTVLWTIVSQPGTISIINPTQLNTATTAATVPGTYIFNLQVTCGSGGSVNQNVTYTVNAGATTPGAITNNAVSNPYCVAIDGTSAITFSGNGALPGGHTQKWTYSSSVFSGSFSSDVNDNPVFTIAPIDKYKCPTTGSITFTRTFTNTSTGCKASVTKTISVITADIPVDAYASLCGGIGLTGTCPGTGTSAWSVVSTIPGTPVTFSNPSGTTTTITNPVIGTQYTIRYTVAGNGCTNGTKDVTFTYSAASALPGTSANAGPDQTYALGLPSAITLNGNEPGAGETGSWTQVTGPGATFANAASAVTSVSGLIDGKVYIFRWTITKANGCSTYDDVVVKGPVLLTPTNGIANCISISPQDPPALTAVTLNSFPFGAVDSINMNFTLLSGPAALGSQTVPIQYFLIGGSGTTCGTAGCTQATAFLSSGDPVSVFTGIPSSSMSASPANSAFGSYSYAVKFYPKVLGTYVFRYEYSVNAGVVQTGTVTIKVSRGYASNAGTDQDLDCAVTSTTLAGSNMFFSNTSNPSNPITYAPSYNGEWSTVAKPAGAPDPLNAGNKYIQSPFLNGLIDGKYTFRLAPNSNLEAGSCGSDDYVDVYVHTVAPTAQPDVNISRCNSGSIQLTQPETGYVSKGWALVSGPSVPTFSPSVTSRTVTIGNLVAGNYQFSFTDSSKCGNAASLFNVTIGASTITQPTITCDWHETPTPRVLTLTATRPDYANGETGEFVRLVKGVEITPFNDGGNSLLYNSRTIASGGATATDTIVTISNWTSNSTGASLVVVYRINKPGCATTTDTLLFTENISNVVGLNQTVELCNQTFPYTYIPVPTSQVPTTGNGPSNFEWLQDVKIDWVFISSPEGATAPTIATPGSINSGITFYTPGTYVLRAYIPELSALSICSGNANGTGTNTFIQFVIKIGDKPSTPTYAGADQIVCAPGTVNLTATPATGTWSISSFNNAPAPTIVNSTNGNTAVNFTAGGDAQLKWTPTATYAWCAANDFDVVKVSYIAKPVIAGAKITNLCSVPSTYVVDYNAPGSSLVTASFTQVSGPNTATITSLSAESSSLSGLMNGTYVFKYSFTSASCGTSDTTVTLVFGTCITVSGHLWIDNDGNAVDNSEANSNLAGTMWAYLTDANGVIVDKSPIDATGFYSFNEVISGGSYHIVLAQNNSAQLGGSINNSSVPPIYSNTGVNLDGSANTGNQTGVIDLGIVTSSQVNQDFGIQRLPESAVNSQVIGVNPGGTVNTPINSSWFQSSNVGANPNTQDYDGGTVNSIRITAFPSNATSITINGTTYYPNVGAIPGGCGTCAVFPGGGVVVPYANGTGPTQAISVDPIDGLPSIVIPFVSIDNAGKEDPTPGSVTITYMATLPVKLENFTASLQNSNVLLQWVVSQELDLDHYDVEYSTDGITYTRIGVVNATGGRTYSFTHFAPVNGINYYRLKSIDIDGKFSYSQVRIINTSNNATSIFVYPNPAKHNVNITMSNSMINKPVTITIVGMDGSIMLRQRTNRASQTETINVSKFAAGKYVVHIVTDKEDVNKVIEVLR